MSDINIYASGLCCCSVCVPEGMEIAEIERLTNLESPTGISSRWTVAEDEYFATGQPMPCPCDKEPGRMHYLLEC